MRQLINMVLGCWLLASAPAALAQSGAQCSPEPRRAIATDMISFCLQHARTATLKNRERAEIFAHLVVATDLAHNNPKTFVAGRELIATYLDQAIAVDPTFVDAYLLRAGLIVERHRRAEVEAVIRQGLKHAPDDGRLLAFLAVLVAKKVEISEIRQMCEDVRASNMTDDAALMHCSYALDAAGDRPEAMHYLRQAAEKVNRRERIGLLTGFPATFEMSIELSRLLSQEPEAPALFALILKRLPEDSALWYVQDAIGEHQLKAGEHLAAADSFALAMGLGNSPHGKMRLALKRMAALITAGKFRKAHGALANLAGAMTKQQILILQLKLKNSFQKDLTITGELDAQTETAVRACIDNAGCFAGMLLDNN